LESYSKNTTESKVTRFISALEKEIAISQEWGKSGNMLRDMRIANFHAFLVSVGKEDLMIPFVCTRTWTTIFEGGIEMAVESEGYLLTQKKLAEKGKEDLLRTAVDLKLSEEEKMKALKDQYKVFYNAFDTLTQAITKLNERK